MFTKFNSQFFYLSILIALFSICEISSTKLCQEDNHWYDADNGKCRPCQSCGTKALELEPCSEYRNTFCADLTLFKFDFTGGAAHKTSAKPIKDNKPHLKWHEMETVDVEDDNNIITAEAIKINHPQELQSSSKIPVYSIWDIAVIIMLCVSLAAVLIAIVVTIVRHPGRWSSNRSDNRKKPRVRLFSRDRLSTTEYMNNLATLDRRLALDEILEKRKRAIFEPPQLLTDEVFVDISGTIPRHFDDDNDHESTKSLLLTNSQYCT